jgi:spiro-SPASM protein
MSLECFKEIVGKIARYSGDAVIDISLWGEPAFHPRIGELIETVLREPSLRLVIETTGIGWDRGLFERVRNTSQRQPTWIVSLDASREEVYRRLRGEGFAQAVRTAEELLALFPATTYVQAVRMKENEEDLEVFFKSWKQRTENIIIQKYDSFSGFLPERAVADLSPLKRFPCWHIKRDLAILIDGTVPLCREDLRVEHPLGNMLREDLKTIWERGAAVYRSHLRSDYPRVCTGCDEYYTYNF